MLRSACVLVRVFVFFRVCESLRECEAAGDRQGSESQ